jgi:hypothetical protein
VVKAVFRRVGPRDCVPGSGLSCPVGLGLLTLLLVASGCVEDASQGLEPVEVASITAPVVGGEVAEACEWPSTVSVNGWGSCTGTLIHSRIVTTAAHCITDGRSNIHFGNRNTPGSFSLEARCEVGAEGSKGANTSRDWAYCVLPEDERVARIPVTPPLVGCEAERFLKSGVEAWVVGFGTTSALGMGAGTKRQVSVEINELNKVAPGTIDVGDAEEGACHGDSGGPLYVHLVDGEHDWGYRVVGSTSGAGARACDCTCSTVYVNIANHVKAIEENEHIDVTPCTNPAGEFEASPACKQLVTGPHDVAGTFPACAFARTIEPIDSCGVLASGGSPVAAGSGDGPASQPTAGAPGSPNIEQLVATATHPAAAFQPVAGKGAAGASAAGRGGTSSATFSVTEAGGGSAQSMSGGGCSIAAPGSQVAVGTRRWVGLNPTKGSAAFVWLLALGPIAVTRLRRRT